MKFRKKPVVIEAVHWTGKNFGEIARFVNDGSLLTKGDPVEIRINTLEGDMAANYGDWIIKGVNGEFYPCKPDIFEATYDAVETNPSLLRPHSWSW